MATFLANSKMSPALAGRIDASVRGKRGVRGGGRSAPSLTSLFRLTAVVAIAGLVSALLYARHQLNLEVASMRRKLLDAVKAESALVTAEDRATASHAEAALLRAAGAYDGDLVASELVPSGAFAALLLRPAMYVRGPIEAFKTTSGILPAASASLKDAFLLCLLEPPATREEKSVLTKVHAAYSGAANVEARTSNVRRLFDAEAGLPLLSPAWAARVESAEDENQLAVLRKQFDGAPLKMSEKALAARLLVFVMDERGEPGGLSELDGERPHPVRVGIVDLATGATLLRLEKRVDPNWISLPKRPQYATGLDSCALALDVRDAVTPGVAKPAP
jgi:hypothetical protein